MEFNVNNHRQLLILFLISFLKASNGQTQGKQWPNGRVPYIIDSSFPRNKIGEINKAINEYASKTCIRFVSKISSDISWVNIKYDASACGRAVGCMGNGARDAAFGGNCVNSGVITHEFGHSLCVSHEHERPDRDNYISFASGCSPSYKWNWRDPRLQDLFYDYLSIEHYESNCFVAKLPGVTHFGSGGPLSVLDANKINAYYDCRGCHSYRFKPYSKLTSNDRLFEAGRERNGNPLYICRFYHNGDIIPGKASQAQNACWLSYNGTEFRSHGSTNFEILTNTLGANLVWRRRPTDGSFPSNAIAGGRTASRETLYIGRCTLNINGQVITIPGKIHRSARGMYVPYGGSEYSCTDYEVLQCG